MFGDLGADVIKIERPGSGDDTRKWGPPFLQDSAGNDTTESAYYLSANRNKRSLALDFTTEKGAKLARDLIAKCDIVTENFKVGSLEKHGLDYASLKPLFPRLIYCSVTGFGQTGPYAPRAGYDFVVQGMGGIMSLTGEKDGQPRFSPTGDRIGFIARRDQEGAKDETPQLYLIPVDGGEAERAGQVAAGIEAFRWCPNGRQVVFVSWVWPELKGAAALCGLRPLRRPQGQAGAVG
jgi:hypothetical protein